MKEKNTYRNDKTKQNIIKHQQQQHESDVEKLAATVAGGCAFAVAATTVTAIAVAVVALTLSNARQTFSIQNIVIRNIAIRLKCFVIV